MLGGGGGGYIATLLGNLGFLEGGGVAAAPLAGGKERRGK